MERETIYRCDVCGNEGVWDKSKWSHWTFLWDIRSDFEFDTCSKECGEKLKSMGRKERKELYFKVYHGAK